MGVMVVFLSVGVDVSDSFLHDIAKIDKRITALTITDVFKLLKSMIRPFLLYKCPKNILKIFAVRMSPTSDDYACSLRLHCKRLHDSLRLSA